MLLQNGGKKMDVNSDLFNETANEMERIVITHGIIKSFEHRGYGLYRLGRGPMLFTNIHMVMEFVQYGRTEDILEVGMRYLPLPLIKDSSDAFQMGRAIEEMVLQLRGPYFLNLQSLSDGSIKTLGRHLIDTVVIEPPFMQLVTDPKFTGGEMSENVIEIPLHDASRTIRQQVMLSLRAPLHPTKKTSKN
jgi:hypothetical protein